MASTNNNNYIVDHRGVPNSTDYRLFFRLDDKPISPWHDIPLYAQQQNKPNNTASASNVYNMIVEIPRWTQEKMEISTKESLSPIKQDTKKGQLRFVANVFPHRGYIWNYGALPQTWENPNHIEPSTNAKGDNDPIDAIEIGSLISKRGDVKQVKVLGTVALIDEDETDWKIICIDIDDPIASQMNNIGDVEKYFPGLLRATIEWFTIYKIPAGKPPNKFAFNGEAKDREFAEKVIEETHSFWKELMNKSQSETDLDLSNTTLQNQHTIDLDKANEVINLKQMSLHLEPAEIPNRLEIDKWHFIRL